MKICQRNAWHGNVSCCHVDGVCLERYTSVYGEQLYRVKEAHSQSVYNSISKLEPTCDSPSCICENWVSSLYVIDDDGNEFVLKPF